jgi:hypothetical protein
MTQTSSKITFSPTLFAQVYGEGAYSCGQYENNCATDNSGSTGVLPPNTSAVLSEPSIVVPGSLLLAILVALISTSIAKLLRRRKALKAK